MQTEDTPLSTPQSSSSPAVLIRQARLLLLQKATETVAWRKRQTYREVADVLHIYLELVERLSATEVQDVR